MGCYSFKVNQYAYVEWIMWNRDDKIQLWIHDAICTVPYTSIITLINVPAAPDPLFPVTSTSSLQGLKRLDRVCPPDD
jgi:hypothetical protein